MEKILFCGIILLNLLSLGDSTCSSPTSPSVLAYSSYSITAYQFDYNPSDGQSVVSGETSAGIPSTYSGYYSTILYIAKFNALQTLQWAFTVVEVSNSYYYHYLTMQDLKFSLDYSKIGALTYTGSPSYMLNIQITDSASGIVLNSLVMTDFIGNTIQYYNSYQSTILWQNSNQIILFLRSNDDRIQMVGCSLTSNTITFFKQIDQNFGYSDQNFAHFNYLQNYVYLQTVDDNQLNPYHMTMKIDINTASMTWNLYQTYYLQSTYDNVVSDMVYYYSTVSGKEFLVKGGYFYSYSNTLYKPVFQRIEMQLDGSIPTSTNIIQVMLSSYLNSQPYAICVQDEGESIVGLLPTNNYQPDVIIVKISLATMTLTNTRYYTTASSYFYTYGYQKYKITNEHNFGFTGYDYASSFYGFTYSSLANLLGYIKIDNKYLSCMQTDTTTLYYSIDSVDVVNVPTYTTGSTFVIQDYFFNYKLTAMTIYKITNFGSYTTLEQRPCQGSYVQTFPIVSMQIVQQNYKINDTALLIDASQIQYDTTCVTLNSAYFTITAVLADTNTTLPTFMTLDPLTYQFQVFTSDLYLAGLYNIRMVITYYGIVLNDSHVWTLNVFFDPTPPFFFSLPTSITIREQTTLNYFFPPISAFMNDQVKVTLSSNTPTFITLFETMLFLNPIYGNAGSYVIFVTITDVQYPSLYSTYTLNVRINPAPRPISSLITSPLSSKSSSSSNSSESSSNSSSETSSSTTISDSQTEYEMQQQIAYGTQIGGTKNNKNGVKEVADLTATITSVSSSSVMIIGFNQPIFIPANFSTFNDSILALTIIPSLDTDMTKLQFTWQIIELKDQTMTIQLTFENPLLVDSSSIKVLFADTRFFRSQLSQRLIATNYKMTKQLPSLLPNGGSISSLNSVGSSISGGLNSILYGNLALNIILSGSLNMLWGMINTLQLIVNVPLFNIKFPANAQFLYSFLVSVTNFNIIPTAKIIAKVFTFTSEATPNASLSDLDIFQIFIILLVMIVPPQLVVLGWDYVMNPTTQQKTQGQCSLPSLSQQQQQPYFCCSDFLPRDTNSNPKIFTNYFLNPFYSIGIVYDYLSNKIFFGVILRYFLEGFLQLGISALLNIQDMSFDNLSDGFSSGLSIFLAICLAAFPVFLALLILIKFKKLDDKNFRIRFGTLYEEIKITHMSSALFNLTFVLRRMIFAILAVMLTDYPFVQLFGFIMLSISQMIYLWYVKPFEEPFQNKLELFNETCILLISYPLLLFTDFIGDPILKYNLGWLLLAITVMNIVVNMSLILTIKIKVITLKIKNWFIRRQQAAKTAKIGSPSRQIHESQITISAMPLNDTFFTRTEYQQTQDGSFHMRRAFAPGDARSIRINPTQSKNGSSKEIPIRRRQNGKKGRKNKLVQQVEDHQQINEELKQPSIQMNEDYHDLGYPQQLSFENKRLRAQSFHINVRPLNGEISPKVRRKPLQRNSQKYDNMGSKIDLNCQSEDLNY